MCFGRKSDANGSDDDSTLEYVAPRACPCDGPYDPRLPGKSRAHLSKFEFHPEPSPEYLDALEKEKNRERKK
jgi:hypothetical protein